MSLAFPYLTFFVFLRVSALVAAFMAAHFVMMISSSLSGG